MTITATNKIASFNEANQSSYTTASVAFTSGKLYLAACLGHSVTPATMSATGSTLTWDSINTQTFGSIASPVKRISVFRCLPSSSPTETVTFSWLGPQTQQHGFWVIDEFDGIDTSGTNGSGAIVQSGINRADSGTTGSVTLSAFGSTDNMAYAFFGRSENENLTEGSGFTPLGEVTGASSPTSSILSEYKLNDNTVDATCASSGAWGMIAIELKAAAAGGGGSVDAFGMMGFFGA